MQHRCKDGTAVKLTRTGPVGTMQGVVFSCPRCGYQKTAEAIERDTIATLNKRFGTAF